MIVPTRPEFITWELLSILKEKNGGEGGGWRGEGGRTRVKKSQINVTFYKKKIKIVKILSENLLEVF